MMFLKYLSYNLANIIAIYIALVKDACMHVSSLYTDGKNGWLHACVDLLQFLACMVITIFQTHALP